MTCAAVRTIVIIVLVHPFQFVIVRFHEYSDLALCFCIISELAWQNRLFVFLESASSVNRMGVNRVRGFIAPLEFSALVV